MAGLQKILLVEDNPSIVDIYSITLKNAGYTLEVALNGDDALAKAKKFRPDVIFLDIILPGKSGLEVLKQFRTKPEYGVTKAKIILLTNLGESDELEKHYHGQADSYVIKAEIMPKDLIRIIKSFKK